MRTGRPPASASCAGAGSAPSARTPAASTRARACGVARTRFRASSARPRSALRQHSRDVER
jgi:hypothetical protein